MDQGRGPPDRAQNKNTLIYAIRYWSEFSNFRFWELTGLRFRGRLSCGSQRSSPQPEDCFASGDSIENLPFGVVAFSGADDKTATIRSQIDAAIYGA
jgi:hypothetical protein